MIYGAAKSGRQHGQRRRGWRPGQVRRVRRPLGFYTPILKGFMTEMGLECANLGMQVFGGHGYIKEHGMEQIARDARISTLVRRHDRHSGAGPAGPQSAAANQGQVHRNFTKRDDCPGQATLLCWRPRWHDGPHLVQAHRAVEGLLTTAHHAARPKTATSSAPPATTT
jgi:hypothetical protein